MHDVRRKPQGRHMVREELFAAVLAEGGDYAAGAARCGISEGAFRQRLRRYGVSHVDITYAIRHATEQAGASVPEPPAALDAGRITLTMAEYAMLRAQAEMGRDWQDASARLAQQDRIIASLTRALETLR